ncbi:MAG TPA: VOC family protein [Bryobacteraceae bacterium]|nr:VOC family protein [Bryobacteraceae bacterium]HPT28657.1 VOC family protein [Bryobacteraceae bacterium]
MLFTGLEHTAIAARSPKELAQWYVDTLGFVINFEYDGNYFVKAPDGAMLEIIPAQGEALAAGAKTPGLRHLAVSVADFDAAQAELAAKGVSLAAPVEVKGNRLAFFSDPEGNLLHLIAREKPLP